MVNGKIFIISQSTRASEVPNVIIFYKAENLSTKSHHWMIYTLCLCNRPKTRYMRYRAVKLKTPVSVIFQILIQNINKNSNTELSTKIIVSVYSKQKHAVSVIFFVPHEKKTRIWSHPRIQTTVSGDVKWGINLNCESSTCCTQKI